MDYRIEKRDAFQIVCKRKSVGKPQSAYATHDITAMWQEYGADGTMEVNSVNVNKLTQTEGELLILNGGSSAV